MKCYNRNRICSLLIVFKSLLNKRLQLSESLYLLHNYISFSEGLKIPAIEGILFNEIIQIYLFSPFFPVITVKKHKTFKNLESLVE